MSCYETTCNKAFENIHIEQQEEKHFHTSNKWYDLFASNI